MPKILKDASLYSRVLIALIALLALSSFLTNSEFLGSEPETKIRTTGFRFTKFSPSGEQQWTVRAQEGLIQTETTKLEGFQLQIHSPSGDEQQNGLLELAGEEIELPKDSWDNIETSGEINFRKPGQFEGLAHALVWNPDQKVVKGREFQGKATLSEPTANFEGGNFSYNYESASFELQKPVTVTTTIEDDRLLRIEGGKLSWIGGGSITISGGVVMNIADSRRVEADVISWEHSEDIYKGRGGVKIYEEDRTVQGQGFEYIPKDQSLTVTGGVSLEFIDSRKDRE
ncbi:MAG: hypothetical protein ACLFN4_03695 [Candidatus Acetothermia bacterium]